MKNKLISAAKKYMYQLDDYPKSLVIEQIEKELNDILELDKDEILEMRLNHFNIGSKKDYKHKWINTSEGYVLAGIRHANANVDKPFVYMWPSFKIGNMKNIMDEIYPYFKVFNPKLFNIWIRPDQNTYQKTHIYQQRFIGEISKMITHDLELSLFEDYFEWYEAEHERFIKENPKFVDRVTINSKEIMDDCLNQGLLFQMKKNNKTLGLVAGEKEVFLGEDSVYLDEILIGTDFRRKGYGPKLLGSFIKKINAKYMTCHIDKDNIGSTRTAIKIGEKVFSQELFFEFN